MVAAIFFDFARDVESTIHEIEKDNEKNMLLEKRRKMIRHTSMINVPLNVNQKSDMLRYNSFILQYLFKLFV